MHWRHLDLEGKTVRSVERSDGDCGLTIRFIDGSYLSYEYAYMEGFTVYDDTTAAVDVYDGNPFSVDDP